MQSSERPKRGRELTDTARKIHAVLGLGVTPTATTPALLQKDALRDLILQFFQVPFLFRRRLKRPKCAKYQTATAACQQHPAHLQQRSCYKAGLAPDEAAEAIPLTGVSCSPPHTTGTINSHTRAQFPPQTDSCGLGNGQVKQRIHEAEQRMFSVCSTLSRSQIIKILTFFRINETVARGDLSGC